MIIGDRVPSNVGEIVIGDYWITPTEYVKARFYIIRKATIDEWIEYRKSENRYYPEMNEGHGYFYEVSTD